MEEKPKRVVRKFMMDGYITMGDAAKILGVTKHTMKKLGTSGKIKMYKFPTNSYQLFEEKDVIEFLKTMKENK